MAVRRICIEATVNASSFMLSTRSLSALGYEKDPLPARYLFVERILNALSGKVTASRKKYTEIHAGNIISWTKPRDGIA
jgi:hypothetical protein